MDNWLLAVIFNTKKNILLTIRILCIYCWQKSQNFSHDFSSMIFSFSENLTTEYGIIWFFSFLFCFWWVHLKESSSQPGLKIGASELNMVDAHSDALKAHLTGRILTSPVFDGITSDVTIYIVSETAIKCLFQPNKNYSNDYTNPNSWETKISQLRRF